ncbi:hypothetical protein [Oceanithermus sp.]
MGKEKVLRLEPGRQARRYYVLGLVFLGVMLALSVWLYFNSSKWFAVLAFLITLDALLAIPRSWRWAGPLTLKGSRLCRASGCRSLEELRGARFEVRNASRVANMREGAIVLEWKNGEIWWVPLSLCGWQELWERIRELHPELGLASWRQDENLRRILHRAWDMPFCAPEAARPALPKAADWAGMLLVAVLAAVATGLAFGLLAIRFQPLAHYTWLGGVISGMAGWLFWRWSRRRRLASWSEEEP